MRRIAGTGKVLSERAWQAGVREPYEPSTSFYVLDDTELFRPLFERLENERLEDERRGADGQATESETAK